MKTYLTYNKTTGHIKTFMSVQSDEDVVSPLTPTDEMGVLEGTPDLTAHHYYVDPDTDTILSRSPNPSEADKLTLTADGVDAVTISNIPLDSVVKVVQHSGFSLEYTGSEVQGTLEITAITPGRYYVQILCEGKFLNTVFTLEAR